MAEMNTKVTAVLDNFFLVLYQIREWNEMNTKVRNWMCISEEVDKSKDVLRLWSMLLNLYRRLYEHDGCAEITSCKYQWMD
jgi:hypothetical protein